MLGEFTKGYTHLITVLQHLIKELSWISFFELLNWFSAVLIYMLVILAIVLSHLYWRSCQGVGMSHTLIVVLTYNCLVPEITHPIVVPGMSDSRPASSSLGACGHHWELNSWLDTSTCYSASPRSITFCVLEVSYEIATQEPRKYVLLMLSCYFQVL